MFRPGRTWLDTSGKPIAIHGGSVIQQGDERPMAKNPHAFSELRALLAAREPLYANAHHVIDTHGKAIDDVVSVLSDAVGSALGPS